MWQGQEGVSSPLTTATCAERRKYHTQARRPQVPRSLHRGWHRNLRLLVQGRSPLAGLSVHHNLENRIQNEEHILGK